MYSKSQESLDYIRRVASHATKPHSTGRIDDLPSWAQEPEDYFNNLVDRYNSIGEQLGKARQQAQNINERLRQTLPFNEYQKLTEIKSHLGPRIKILEEQHSSYRMLARAAAEKSWATTFFLCAKELLPKEIFLNIITETEKMLGRVEAPIKMGDAEKTPEQRAVLRRKESHQVRRSKFRASRTESILVWSDEKGGVQTDRMKQKIRGSGENYPRLGGNKDGK